MKYTSFTLSRWQNIGLRAIIACVVAAFAGSNWGLLVGLLNPDGFGTALLGASYTRINATTKSNLTSQNADIQEELWVRGITGPSAAMYQLNPFYDQLSGSGRMVGDRAVPSGKNGTLAKAILNISDTTKVQGRTIHMPTYAGLGGPGVSGEGDRIGSEQKLRIGAFDVSIGRYWFGAGWTAVARDETMIGSVYDSLVANGLRQQVAKKKSDDTMMKIIQRAGTSGPNYVLPDGVAARANLTASNVFSTSLITKLQSRLQLIGAVPMDFVNNDGGFVASKFVTVGPSDGMRPLKTETAYLEAVTHADVRGDLNALFRGNFKDWDGMGLYPWEHIRHANWGSVGSPLLPLAFLGGTIDVSGTTTGLFVTGGGSAAAAAITPAPQYFEFFSNAPYTFTNGDTIAAVTGTDRYLRITNPDGGKLILKYRLNDGNKITLPVSALVTGVTGFDATTATVGATIEECNVGGVPFCRFIALGQQAIVCGAGSIAGTNGGSGRRTSEERNHGLEFAVGIEYAWGCEAYKRPDDVYSGFILVETAKPTAA